MLRRLPPEAAHELTLRALELGAVRFLGESAGREPDPPALAQRLKCGFGILSLLQTFGWRNAVCALSSRCGMHVA